MFSTRRLNSSVRKFYEKHANELTKQRAHIREATQQLIDRLMREIWSNNYDEERFKFDLFNSNYKNITVLKKKGIRFVCTVRARSKSAAATSTAKQ